MLLLTDICDWLIVVLLRCSPFGAQFSCSQLLMSCHSRWWKLMGRLALCSGIHSYVAHMCLLLFSLPCLQLASSACLHRVERLYSELGDKTYSKSWWGFLLCAGSILAFAWLLPIYKIKMTFLALCLHCLSIVCALMPLYCHFWLCLPLECLCQDCVSLCCLPHYRWFGAG